MTADNPEVIVPIPHSRRAAQLTVSQANADENVRWVGTSSTKMSDRLEVPETMMPHQLP